MNPTTSVYNDPNLIAARTAAQNASSTAGTEAAASISLPDQLRAALNSKFSSDNPIYAQREGALKDYLNATTQAPLNVTPVSAGGTATAVYNPAQQANLIQQYKSGPLAHLATLNDLLGLSTGGIENVIGATSRADQGAVAGLQAKAQTANQSYQDLLGELSKRAEEAYQNKSLAQTGAYQNAQLGLEQQRINQSYGLNPMILKNGLLQSVAQDAQSGMQLKDIMQKYSTQSVLDPTEILHAYNVNSKFGPAKESPADLQALFGIKNPMPIEQQNRILALKPAIQLVQGATNQSYTGTGPQARFAQFSIDHLGGFGVPQSLVKQNQNFSLLRQQVVRALQGARMSDQDIAQATQYIPNILDTSNTIKTKLGNLNDFLTTISGGTPNSSSSTNSGWE